MSNKIKKIDKRSIAVVTTFSQKGYIAHGHKMIQTFDRKWPKNVDLYVYYENKKPNIKSKRIHYINIEDACTELVDFKKNGIMIPVHMGGKVKKDLDINGWL